MCAASDRRQIEASLDNALIPVKILKTFKLDIVRCIQNCERHPWECPDKVDRAG